MRHTLAALLFVFAIACNSKVEPPLAGRFDATGADLKPEDYTHVYASWTRHNRLYEGLENKIFVTSTFLTPEMREAVRITFPDVVGHGGVITRDELAAAAPNNLTFFVSVYTADRKWNDLQTPTSIWKVTLQTVSGEIAPTSIARIKVDQNLRTVFPSIGRYDECYLIRFPPDGPGGVMVSDSTTNVGLRLASGLGDTSLDFSMVRGQAPVPDSGDPPIIPAVR